MPIETEPTDSSLLPFIQAGGEGGLAKRRIFSETVSGDFVGVGEVLDVPTVNAEGGEPVWLCAAKERAAR
jgi:hypothetical protein